ncbi:unnamed protein product, partial [Adineta steineri]
RRSQRLNEPNEILLNNALKYRKKLQAGTTQINRTKKSSQQSLDSADSAIHVARLINDIGQLSDCKSLQEIGSLVDSLAMRQQLSSRIYNEYALNSLQQAFQKLNDNLSNDFDKTKSVFEESITNHCSDHTKKQIFDKVQTEWNKHQKLATKELKRGLSSYCDIGLYNLRIQTAILERLQGFIDELPHDGNEPNTSQPDFANRSLQTRKDIDTMLRIMLDQAPNDSSLLPKVKRSKFLSNQLPLSSTLYSSEITAAAARSHGQSLRQQNEQIIPQYPSIPPSSASAMASAQTPQLGSVMMTPITPHNNQFQNLTNDDHLPSYTDLFVVPSSCKQTRIQRRSPRINS